MSHHTTYADLGGLPGFGVVASEPEGNLLHADWERQALALTLAVGATDSWNIDQTFWSARIIIAGIEIMHMIRKGQRAKGKGQRAKGKGQMDWPLRQPLSAAQQFNNLAV